MSYGAQNQGPSGGRSSPGQAHVDQQGQQGLFGSRGGVLQQEARSRDGRTEVDLLRDVQRSLGEADQIAGGTLDKLDSQTEQLEKIQVDAEIIDGNLDKSEYLLRGLKPWGWFRNLWRKDPEPAVNVRARPSQGGYPSSSSSEQPGARGAARLMADERARNDLKLGAGSQAGNATALRPDQQRNAEVDKAYDDIDSMLDGLKEKSKVINKTLDQHNQMLPGIDASIGRNQERINKQQADMRRLAGRS